MRLWGRRILRTASFACRNGRGLDLCGMRRRYRGGLPSPRLGDAALPQNPLADSSGASLASLARPAEPPGLARCARFAREPPVPCGDGRLLRAAGDGGEDVDFGFGVDFFG